MKEISAIEPATEKGAEAQVNSIYMMAHSGARGSPAQMRQLAGMRGLMAKPSRRDHREPDHLELQGRPLRARVLQLDARRPQGSGRHRAQDGEFGLSDPASRRRGEGLHHHRRGLRHQARHQGARHYRRRPGGVLAGERILGRTAAEDVQRPVEQRDTGRRTARCSKSRSRAARHRRRARDQDPLGAHLRDRDGVCGKCYGRDLARGTPVNIGEAVGVIAAQSIGEPGTQLTMRTFHIGGAAQIAEQSFVESNFEGKIRIKNRNVVRNSDGDLIVMGRNLHRCGHRSGRHRAGRAPHPVRRAAQGRGRRAHQARPAHRRVGSLYPPDHDRSRRHGRVTRIWSKVSH